MDWDADYVLMVVNSTELQATLTKCIPKHKLRPLKNNDPAYSGKIGRYKIAVVQSSQGATGPSGATLVTYDAINQLKPKAVISVGICFGTDTKKQNFGDICISNRLACYDAVKKTDAKTTQRGDYITVAYARNFTQETQVGLRAITTDERKDTECQIHRGLVISGAVLADSKDWVDGILQKYPGADAGEMEGVGIYSACQRANKPWIIIKAISDFGGLIDKTDEYQKIAAENAAAFARDIIERGLADTNGSIHVPPAVPNVPNMSIHNSVYAGNDADIAAYAHVGGDSDDSADVSNSVMAMHNARVGYSATVGGGKKKSKTG